MNRIASFLLYILQGQPSFVGEPASAAYGSDFVPFPDEKDLLRAHLVVELIERYRYSPASLVAGAYVPLKHNGVDYTEVDIIVHDAERRPFILAAVEVPQNYEQHTDEIMQKLFAVAVLMRQKHGPRYLMYYTRWYEGETRRVRQLVVDCSTYQTFSAWHDASRPALPDVPSNG